MITVMGATGHTGSQIVKQLLSDGTQVRALGRSEGKLAPLKDGGADVLAGDPSDPAFLTQAFRDADAVYTLLPYEPHLPGYLASQDRLGEAIVKALRDAGVRYAVALSSVGADRAPGIGLLAGHHVHERRLRALEDTSVLILRAGSFFENFEHARALIEQEGINGDSIAPDVKLPMIATADIATVAAEALRARDWQGIVVRELLGQRDLTYAEATSILGARLGKPDLEYVQFSDTDMAGALTQLGFAADFVELTVELNRAISDGTVAAREERTPANTTPTRFEEFADRLV